MKGWKWTIVLDELGYWAGVVSVVPPPSVISINRGRAYRIPELEDI